MDNSDKPLKPVPADPMAAPVSDAAGTDNPAHEPRGAFALKGATKKANKTTVWIVVGALTLSVALLIGLFTAVSYAWNNEPNAVDETEVKEDPGLTTRASDDDAIAQYKAAVAKKEQEDREKAEADRKRREQQQEQQRLTQPSSPPPGGSRTSGAPAAAVETPQDRKLGSGVVVKVATMEGGSYGASSTGEARDAGRPPAVPAASASDSDYPLSGGSSSRSRGTLSGLGRTPAGPATAYLAPDGKYLLRNNTYARCALYTEVITEHESRLTCFLVSPLYSSDGSTLLADAGARMTGEQKIEMKPGQAQVFTQWNDLEVESGQPGVPNVRTRFDALGTGPMGSSGTKGWIDNKYIDRYGGAIVLTATKDLLQALSNTTQRNSGSGGYTINNSEQNVEDMATKTLDANININPVGYLLPGTVINVTIARDIDFSSVYENR